MNGLFVHWSRGWGVLSFSERLVLFTNICDYFLILEIIYRLWTRDNTRNNSIVRLLQNEKCIDLMLGLKCGYHFRPWLWPWPWIVKYGICYVPEKLTLGLQCGHNYLGYASMTLIFCRSLLTSTSHVSGIVGLIATNTKTNSTYWTSGIRCELDITNTYLGWLQTRACHRLV